MKEDLKIKNRLGVVDAVKIAMEVLGLPITNTTMLGSLVKASEVVEEGVFCPSLQPPVWSDCSKKYCCL